MSHIAPPPWPPPLRHGSDAAVPRCGSLALRQRNLPRPRRNKPCPSSTRPAPDHGASAVLRGIVVTRMRASPISRAGHGRPCSAGRANGTPGSSRRHDVGCAHPTVRPLPLNPPAPPEGTRLLPPQAEMAQSAWQWLPDVEHPVFGPPADAQSWQLRAGAPLLPSQTAPAPGAPRRLPSVEPLELDQYPGASRRMTHVEHPVLDRLTVLPAPSYAAPCAPTQPRQPAPRRALSA